MVLTNTCVTLRFVILTVLGQDIALTTFVAGQFRCPGTLAPGEDYHFYNPDDCTKFYKCEVTDEIPAEQECPAPLVVNPYLNLCDWPYNSSCGDGSTTPCTSAPCLNGGGCLVGGSTTYACNCAAGFSGENCQILNVAINKTYHQISTWVGQGPSSNAANGNTSGRYDANNCIHTDFDASYRPVPQNTPHWWEVDLGRTFPVRDIAVWARAEFLYRLYPFTITVDGQTCVSVTSPPRTGTYSVTCSSVMYGRVVRLTYTRTRTRTDEMLNMCEFQIFVPSGVSQCPAGHHGAQCGQTCSDNCGGGPGKNFCYQDTGVCYDGCTGHFADDFCTVCQPGYHGDQCTSPCSSLRSRCTQCSQDGTCTACNGHFMPPDCTSCPDGRFGNQCERICFTGCARCDQRSGICTACTSNSHLALPGCTECEDGYYKQAASSCIQCPVTCDNDTPCDKTTGHCEMCPPGKTGDICDQDCQPGLYGEGCSTRCGYCRVNTTCHHQDGRCPEGCVSGFTEPFCLQVKEDASKDSLVASVVGSVIGAAVIIVVGVLAAVCWYRRSRGGPTEKRAALQEHGRTRSANKTMDSSDPRSPSSPSPPEDTTYYEISDTANTHEMREVQNNYDVLNPYSNDDADRQPYAQLTSHASDVTKSSENTAYVNTACL